MSDSLDLSSINVLLQLVSHPKAIECASMFAGFTWLIPPKALFKAPITSILIGIVSAHVVKYISAVVYNCLPNTFKPVFVIALTGSGLMSICLSLCGKTIVRIPTIDLPPRYQE